VLLGFSIMVVGIIGEAVYSNRSFAELELMEHESSILYGPVNALWHSVQHRFAWDIPDHVIMALLVLVISAIVFPLASRRISRDNPGRSSTCWRWSSAE
jgi:hypothetical protein